MTDEPRLSKDDFEDRLAAIRDALHEDFAAECVDALSSVLRLAPDDPRLPHVKAAAGLAMDRALNRLGDRLWEATAE